MAPHENLFVFGEIIDDANVVSRTNELNQLVRDLGDGQKVFLLSPRRFGKSSLVALALLKLKKRHIHTVSLTVSSYSSYAQFLEKFAEKVLRAADSCCARTGRIAPLKNTLGRAQCHRLSLLFAIRTEMCSGYGS